MSVVRCALHRDPLAHLEDETAARDERDRLAWCEPGRHLPFAHLVDGPEAGLARQREVEVEEGSLLAASARRRWAQRVTDDEVAARSECMCRTAHELPIRG